MRDGKGLVAPNHKTGRLSSLLIVWDKTVNDPPPLVDLRPKLKKAMLWIIIRGFLAGGAVAVIGYAAWALLLLLSLMLISDFKLIVAIAIIALVCGVFGIGTRKSR